MNLLRIFITLWVCCFLINGLSAQSKRIPKCQKTPEKVMQTIFKAAKKQAYSKLYQLCPPDKNNDGDTRRYICEIASSSNEMKKEFVSYFKNARITGETIYETTFDGVESARVPFWFNHPGGERRSNETMNMIKIEGRWYLYSF